ncbi:FIMAH domain-containing protein [Nocardioides bizhenqiangii]|uniref:Uncharacterized protein n=1 Tax=Nocardioides bizhenqiangii TaxID=3095076 RepID=A0ABZ0ZV06_9ACTN|nr:hypothetical protein [Nocardioides sp. HM61]WQQ27482.1 hypothetical protein SHK19_04445 [Nocardioides sp. HM61]
MPRLLRGRWRAAVVAAVVLLAPTGCADDPPPSESVPALEQHLDEVDAAIEAGEPDEARRAVEDLIAEAAQARVEGDLSDEEADRIFDAAQQVLDQLPKAGPKDDEDEKPDD